MALRKQDASVAGKTSYLWDPPLLLWDFSSVGSCSFQRWSHHLTQGISLLLSSLSGLCLVLPQWLLGFTLLHCWKYLWPGEKALRVTLQSLLPDEIYRMRRADESTVISSAPSISAVGNQVVKISYNRDPVGGREGHTEKDNSPLRHYAEEVPWTGRSGECADQQACNEWTMGNSLTCIILSHPLIDICED